MRHVVAGVLAAFTIGAVVAPSRGAAQSPRAEPLTLEGTLHAGDVGEVKYQVIKPAAWNGTLVLDLDFTTSWNPVQRQWFLDRGYAIGGTHRNQNESGYNVREIVENQVALRRLLSEKAGTPKRTIAFGVSRGAIISRSMIDMHPEIFDAALAFAGGGAGVIGYLQSKLDQTFVLKTLVDPASTLPLVNLPRPQAGGAVEMGYAAMLEKARSTAQGRARLTLAAAFDQQPRWSLVRTPKPAADDLDTQAANMQTGFNPNLGPRWQAEAVNGGNVSWNHGVDYRAALEKTGVADVVRDQYRKTGLVLQADLEALAKAPRIAADPAVVAKAERNYSYTGKVRGPVLSLKTVGDPADPPSSDTAYNQTLQRAGTRDLLRVAYIDRPGHSTQSLLEKVAAFQYLMNRLESGRWDEEAAVPANLNALAAELAGASTVALGDSRFVNFQPAQALRTWDFTNFGTYRPAGATSAQSVARTTRDGVYSAAQADRGHVVFERACARCHGSDLRGDEIMEVPALADEHFAVSWGGEPLFALFRKIGETMPASAPGSLSPRERADTVAYLLRANHFPAGLDDLGTDPDLLNRIQISP